ncbi:unnamed protein product, partial [Ixodes persulcatus]
KQKLAADRVRAFARAESFGPRQELPSWPPWSAGRMVSPSSALSLLVRMFNGTTWHWHVDHVRPCRETWLALSAATSEDQPAGGSMATPVVASGVPTTSEATSVRQVRHDSQGRPLQFHRTERVRFIATPGLSTPAPRQSTHQWRSPGHYSPG